MKLKKTRNFLPPCVYNPNIEHYRVTQLFHAIYSSGSGLPFLRAAKICSLPLNYRYNTSPLNDLITRRVRHQIVWQARRVVLQPINSIASHRTRTRTKAMIRKCQLRFSWPLLLAFTLVFLDTILVRDRGNPGTAAGQRHAHAVFFLAILRAWCAFPEAILPAAGLEHGTLAPPVCIQNLRYKNQAIFSASILAISYS